MTRYPFEFHHTVKITSEEDINKFKVTCSELKVKPILVGMTSGVQDLMTSARMLGSINDAYTYLKELSGQLSSRGFQVIREKLETVPWYLENDVPGTSQYFECHYQVPVDESTDYEKLASICKTNNAHLSRNLFKVFKTGGIQMITIRNYNSKDEFQNSSNKLLHELSDISNKISMEQEFVVLDTNLSLDDHWITRS